MSMFDSIEKLITEHGSAAILGQQLAFAKDQFADLERKVSDLQTQVGRLEAQLERERTDHKQTRDELQRLPGTRNPPAVTHESYEKLKRLAGGGRGVADASSHQAGASDCGHVWNT